MVLFRRRFLASPSLLFEQRTNNTFFFLKEERERGRRFTLAIDDLRIERERERETRVCVCVYDARVDEMMIFFEDRAREYNLVRRLLKKIDPLGLLLLFLLFLSFPFLGGEFFFFFPLQRKGSSRQEFAFFSQKKINEKEREREESEKREEFVTDLCLSFLLKKSVDRLLYK